MTAELTAVSVVVVVETLSATVLTEVSLVVVVETFWPLPMPLSVPVAADGRR